MTRALGPDSDALVLAGGSNVVLADDLTDLTVVLLANTEITVEDNVVRAEAGAVWDDVVVTSLAHGLGGLECLSGIPGSAGATPVQNVGAYGAEVADTIRRVRLLDRRTGEDRWVAPEALQFGYRTSILKHSSGRDRARGGVRAGPRRAQRAAALRRTGRCAWRRTGFARRRDPRAGGGAGAAGAQGHGARRSRPRHLERRVVLHQPRRCARRVRAAAAPRRRRRAQLSGARRRRSWPRAGSWSGPASGRATPATAPRRGCRPSMRWL